MPDPSSNTPKLPSSAHFDYGNLYAQVPFTAAKFHEAYNDLRLDSGRMPILLGFGDLDKLAALIEVAGIVEHEYFHCRNILSTPNGYALFIVRQILLNQRGDFLEAIWENQEALPFLNSRKLGSLVREVKRGRISKRVLDSWCYVQLWALVYSMLLEPRRETMTLIHGISSAGHFSFNPFAGREPGETARYHPQLEAIKPESVTDEPFTTPHLIEGLAIWKEYAYVSRLAAASRHFRSITDQWVKRWRTDDLYRRALDGVYAQTGCNASTVLPGVLFEIALTCPVFSQKPMSWEEFHPSARFRKILGIAPSLPERFRQARPDNLDVIKEEYYLDIERHICEKLGWSSSIDNLKAAMDAITARVEYGRKNAPSPGADVLGRFMDRRFLQAHHHRTEYPGLMLFPWNHPHATEIGLYTQPPVTVFEDVMTIHPWPDEEPWRLELFLKDLVVSLTFEAMVHPYETTRRPFHRARVIFARIAGAVGEERFKIGDGSFEALLSSKLGFDYAGLRNLLARHPVQ